jgi:hypothetical protein
MDHPNVSLAIDGDVALAVEKKPIDGFDLP